MSAPFAVAALPRADGSEVDGIHLMWSAPPSAGYSLDGWEIRRRKALRNDEVRCHSLSSGELDVLHRVLRLETPVARIAVRAAACPLFPQVPPDEGPGGDGPPAVERVLLGELETGRGANPRVVDDVTVEVLEATGEPLVATTVRSLDGQRGLDCGSETRLSLPVLARSVDVELVCASGSVEVEAFGVDEQSAGVARVTAGQGATQTVRLSGAALARLEVRSDAPGTLLAEVRFDPRRAAQAPAAAAEAETESRLPPVAPLARGAARLGTGTAPAQGCAAYDIRLPKAHRIVEVHVGVPAALAIAMRAGKAVAARTLVAPSGTQSTRFQNLDVDGVVLYATVTASLLDICVDDPPDPAEEEQAWAGEPVIAKGLRVPVRALDPSLGSQADEDALAKSRLLPGESFDELGFHDATELMNAAGGDADRTPPVWASTVVREEIDDPFLELRPWSYALALLVDPAWRRMLGFGFLDPASDLEPGTVYDYRVTGRFRRRDLEERVHGFHSVPRGTTLPSAFALGGVSLLTPEPVLVEQFPGPAEDGFTATGRKGIALAGEPCLTLSFAVPVTRVALDLGGSSALRWKASTTDFLPGLPVNSFGGDLPPEGRATIETPEPVDTITLSGSGLLFAVRELFWPAGASPDDVVSRSVTLHGVTFASTPAPAAPAFLGTLNVQEPSVAPDPAGGPGPAPASLGFRLSWLPPAPGTGPVAVPWPPDLAAFPPFDALGFQVERRRADSGGPFEELDGPGLQPLVLGSRGGQRDPPALGPGVDLEAIFEDEPSPTPPLSPLMSLDDVLVSAEHEGPPPGSTHQYRIFSVDAIGRRSANATTGSVVRLEKRRPPPQPVGSPAPPAAGAIAPRGVAARVLQTEDPDLTPQDRALLGASQNAVLLEWGWTQAEREADPHAREFRIYWQPLASDVVSGEVTGPATSAAGLFHMPATLDRPLAADAMNGRYLALPDYPFKVASHTAGESVTLSLEPSLLEPTRVPAPAAFEFRPPLDGAEQRPPAWAERSSVVALSDEESYRHVFRDRLTLDADRPRARVWVGVSAADDQPYVDDALPPAAANGGRPGNESAIASAAAEARYLGRPELNVPPPLPDVPEHVTDEPAGETVAVAVDLPALLPAVAVPAGHSVQLERVGLDLIAACISANPDDTIGAALPDGSTSSYTLGNPADNAALLAQIRSSTPARVEGRFLMDFLLRFPAQLEPLWTAALPDPVGFAALTDVLPNKAERYVHRIRLADPAGHVSAGTAIAAQIVRVPSMRSPATPRLTVPAGQNDELAVEARVRDAFDLSWVVLFSTEEEARLAPNGNLRSPATLLRLPNRRDLYPQHGLRLRLPDGTLLEPELVLDAGDGTVEAPDRILTATLTPGHDRRVALWSIAVTRDGLPSRAAGPLVALTGPAPLTAPQLTVTSVGGSDTATWTPTEAGALLALERSTDGGSSWRQVSPWLPERVADHTLPSADGNVRYRVSLRADRGRRVTGPAVEMS